MRRMLSAFAFAALIAAMLIAPARAAPHCPPGQEPKFVHGFAHLKSLIGDEMGDPIECEHANPENGDTLQNTTTGLAFYRKSTNTPTFTNGWDHWAWTSEGLVYWTGSAVDPPDSAAPSEPVSDPPTDPLKDAGREVILFASDRDTVGTVRYNDIYLMNADGTGLERLTTHPRGDSYPALSPDGAKIAFVSSRVSAGDVYTMNVDGSDIKRLTNNVAGAYQFRGYAGAPAWSPDGLRIAFHAERDIFVIRPDGSNLTRLTSHPADDRSPTWSPDGGWIAFVSDRDQNYSIHIMPSEGEHAGQERITTDAGWETSPAWSPDGARIAFAKRKEGFEACHPTHIYTMNVHGGDQRAVTGSVDAPPDCSASASYFDSPTWSPDSQRIAFQGGGGISIANADGSGMTLLAPNKGRPEPSWGVIRADLRPSAQPTAPPQPQSEGTISAGLEVLADRQEQVPGLADLSATLRGMQDRISFAALPENVLGRYALDTRSISLNNALSSESAEAVAMVLAHEGRHALDHNLGRIPGDSLACFDSEVRAFDIQIALWQVIWGSQGKPDPLQSWEQAFNNMLEIKQESPITYVYRLVELYGDQCGTA